MSRYLYNIVGWDNQMLELDLEPGQSIQAEKGAMTYMDDAIRMNTRFGEGTGLLGAIKRKLSGEGLLINEFVNDSNRRSLVALSPQRPSHIIMVPLSPARPDIVCRPDTFLAGSPDVAVSITRGAWGPALIGKSNLIMQRLHGDGEVFVVGNGAVVEKKLRPGQTVTADIQAIIAFESTVTHGARMLKGLKNQLFGGESLIIVTATGPGSVWFQSLSHFKSRRIPRQNPHPEGIQTSQKVSAKLATNGGLGMPGQHP